MTPASRHAALVALLSEASMRSHSRRSFLDHLIGTHRILTAWGQPAVLCTAGLLHSIYGTEFYPDAIVSRSHRNLVRTIAGTDAERIVHAFCTLDRGLVWSQQLAAGPLDGRPLRVARRVGAGAGKPIVIPSRLARALVLLECANLAEQACADDGGPAVWMSRVLAGWRSLLEMTAATILSAQAERAAIAAYSRALVSPPSMAVGHLRLAIRYNPFAGEAYILAALCTATPRLGDVGASLLTRWATTWDKRLSLEAWRDAAARARGRNPRRIFTAICRILLARMTDRGWWHRPAQGGFQ